MPRPLGRGLLEAMRLIDHHHREVPGQFDELPKPLVIDDDPLSLGIKLLDGHAIARLHRGDLAGPVDHEAGQADDQRRPALRLDVSSNDGLSGFTEAHIVSEKRAAPAHQVRYAGTLIVIQLIPRQSFGQGSLGPVGASDLRNTGQIDFVFAQVTVFASWLRPCAADRDGIPLTSLSQGAVLQQLVHPFEYLDLILAEAKAFNEVAAQNFRGAVDLPGLARPQKNPAHAPVDRHQPGVIVAAGEHLAVGHGRKPNTDPSSEGVRHRLSPGLIELASERLQRFGKGIAGDCLDRRKNSLRSSCTTDFGTRHAL